MSRYVQYGCGYSNPHNWINYDASPTLKLERIPILGKLIKKNDERFPSNILYGDIVKGLPEKENSCDGIYCSHVLEHLSLIDFRLAITNTYKILKVGGVFRCVLPDLKAAVDRYIANYENSNNGSILFMEETMLGVNQRNKSIFGILTNYFGNSKHLWMWDYKSLAYELEKVGFKNIRECKFNDSSDNAFIDVEEESRFYSAVSIECIK
jgi:predicted SAM-dependent methyltransferase